MKETLLAAGGVIGALVASMYCIVPLALVSVSVGVSGAWIGTVTALAPYQPLFLTIAFVCLGAGFWLVYLRGTNDCDTEACADPKAGRVIKSVVWVKGVLWLGAALAALSVGIDYSALLRL